jgi:hypothetical protein
MFQAYSAAASAAMANSAIRCRRTTRREASVGRVGGVVVVVGVGASGRVLVTSPIVAKE